jgi:hypothetical protein
MKKAKAPYDYHFDRFPHFRYFRHRSLMIETEITRCSVLEPHPHYPLRSHFAIQLTAMAVVKALDHSVRIYLLELYIPTAVPQANIPPICQLPPHARTKAIRPIRQLSLTFQPLLLSTQIEEPIQRKVHIFKIQSFRHECCNIKLMMSVTKIYEEEFQESRAWILQLNLREAFCHQFRHLPFQGRHHFILSNDGGQCPCLPVVATCIIGTN